MSNHRIAGQLQALIKEQIALAKQMEDNRGRIEKFEAQVEKRMNAVLLPIAPEAYFYVSLSGGSATSSWMPDVDINGVFASKDHNGGMFIKVNGEWVFHKDYAAGSNGVYAHKLDYLIKPNFDTEAFEAACVSLSEDFGIPVKVREYEVIGKPERLRCVDDLLVIHPEATVLHTGEVWHMGWDISDKYVILQCKDGIHVYYSTNGHGFGYDFHQEPGESLDDFVAFLKGDDQKVPSEVTKILGL